MCWTITEEDQYDLAAVDRLGDKFVVGNGYFAYRGTLEEYTKAQKIATTISALCDKAGSAWSEPVNLPNGGYVQVFYQGKPLHVLAGGVECHAHSLDFTHGMHFRRTVFKTPDGNLILIRARRFASLAQCHLFCLEYTIQPAQEGEFVIHTGIDGDVWASSGPHLEQITPAARKGTLSLVARTPENHIPVAVCEAVSLPGGQETLIQEEKRILREIRIHLNIQHPYTFVKYVSLYSGLDSQNPLEEGEAACREAARQGFAALYREHCERWNARWKGCGNYRSERPQPAAVPLAIPEV